MRTYKPHKQWLSRASSTAPAALLLLLLAVEKVIITEQSSSGTRLQSSLNGQLRREPKSDYDRISVEMGSAQTEHEAVGELSSMRKEESHQLALSQNDPFALTFEDYLREASKSSAHHIASEDDSSFSADAIQTNAGLIIEDNEQNSAQSKESPIIDYIFPPSRQETSSRKYDEEHETKLITKKIDNIESNSKQLFNEIRLLFSWKQLPTNKCSKTCGKGFRLNHLSCVDLKYDVKVEDVLCLKSNLTKPSETSDEPCNEIDCPPQWSSVEFKECNAVSSESCQSKLYERAQCTMIDRRGALVYLEDSKCSAVENSVASSDRETNETQRYQSTSSAATRFSVFEDEVNADDTSDVDERNDILPNLDVSGSLESLLNKASSNQAPQNEPFFEPGPWSNCSGASCGQLGSRTRKLSCRLYLSRSSKFAELPESSCQNAPIPDSQEPCYMDCGPANSSYSAVSNFMVSGSDANDEMAYDLEMTRFIWQQGGWTKCSADCLGGKRESVVECWDNESKVVVEPFHCTEESRPRTVFESCNDTPCTPEWRTGEFTECTRPCGSAGLKSRIVDCVQQVPSHRGPSFLVVSNDLCIQTYGSMPNKTEHCNRVDCKPEWSVGPWSECSKKCGDGIRNRTAICVQEFANKEGPLPESYIKKHARLPSPDLLEAISISGKNWSPGQVTQVPFHECYEEYKTVPPLDEKCFTVCEKEPYIDADVHQEYHMSRFSPTRKKSITLRIGGKAEITEGQNLRIRCRIVNGKSRDNLVNKKQTSQQVEWRKDGIQIFLNGSKVADKQYIPEDNSIFGSDVFADEKNQFMADEPSSKKTPRSGRNHPRRRNLMVRSWNSYQGASADQVAQGGFNFVPQRGGRFSLKENILRIKKLKLDDSGTYTCSYGLLSESIEVKVVSRRDSDDAEQKLLHNLGL